MIFGGDFFKIFSFVIQVIRLIIEIFGDDEDRQKVLESKERTANHSANEAC